MQGWEDEDSTHDVLANAKTNWPLLSGRIQRAPRLWTEAFTASAVPHRAVAGGTGGLWRIALAENDVSPVSLIVKRLVPSALDSARWGATSDPADPFYWGREALAYESEFFGDSRMRIRAARCYFVDRRQDAIDLYLEDVAGTPGGAWEIERYAIAAEHLGQYQAAAVSLPNDAPWLRGRTFFEEYIARRAELYANAEALTAVPSPYLEKEALRELAPAIRALWDDRERVFAYFRSLPATRCHYDFWSPNLFESPVANRSETVAIDLAYAGLGPPGHDPANLVADAVMDFFVTARDAQPLWDAASAAYRRGLSTELGNDVVLAAERVMELTVALKFAWLIPATFRIASTQDGVDWVARTHGDPAAFFRKRSAALRFVGRFVEHSAELLRTMR